MMQTRRWALWLVLSVAAYASAAAQPTVFVTRGSDWKYLDDGSDQGTSWSLPGFDDAAWAAGAAPLGYGEGDEATTVSYGSDPENKHITTYFRRTFDVAGASEFRHMVFGFRADDSAIVYVNGVEVLRFNIAYGTTTHTTPAWMDIPDTWDEQYFNERTVAANALAEGENLLAVEIHQFAPDTPDMGFDLEMTGLTEKMRKGPYLLYPGVNTEMTILWQLDSTATCTLEWGRDQNYALGRADTSEYGEDHQHLRTLTDLAPGGTYFYRVGVDADWYPGSFRAAPAADARNVKFFAYGDTRTYSDWHDQVLGGIAATYASDADFQTLVVHVGDWTSNGEYETNWTHEFFGRLRPNTLALQASVPIQGCMGNHEETGVLFRKYWPYPYEADRYWSFDYGPAHFTMVDQYAGLTSSSAQLAWIGEDLAASDKPWKFVVLHEPGWTSGAHPNNAFVQEYIQPLCEANGVSIVFSGHNHYYSRAYVRGVHHVTTGAGGAPLYQPGAGFPNIIKALSVLEFCKIDIQGDVLEFEAVTPDGTRIDSFTIPGEGPPVLESAVANGDGTVGLTWSNAHRAPFEFLATAYDLYTGTWVERSANGSMWYHFAPDETSGTLGVGGEGGLSGGYVSWIGNQYEDGSYYPSDYPLPYIILDGAPHAPLGLAAFDLGAGVAHLSWTPEVYGTWTVWAIAYDAESGAPAVTSNAQGEGLWHYAAYGGEDFAGGTMQLVMPSGGAYLFYVAALGWDALTWGEYSWAVAEISEE